MNIHDYIEHHNNQVAAFEENLDMAHTHYWQIESVEKWSPDRFHIHFTCECGAAAESAHGIAGKMATPYVIDKVVPGPEEHFILKGLPVS